MDYTAGEIDPRRPWIRDPRDAPASMNWVQVLFNPLGRSGKVHFTRAWTFMFMGRLLLYLVPSLIVALAGLAGVRTAAANIPVDLIVLTVPALLVPFALFTLLTDLTSFIAHVRRLADAGRSTLLAVLVLVPLLAGMCVYMLGTGMGAAQYRMLHSAAETSSPAEEEGQEGRAGREPGASSGASAPGERRGRGGQRMQKMKEMSERQMAVSTGMSMALPVWGLLSFFVMLWTLLFVARLPNGVGDAPPGPAA